MTSPRVTELDASSDPRWDAYVRRHPRATANHLAGWAPIMASAYGFKPTYLALEDAEGAIHGVMPLVYARGVLSGPRLTSMPALRWAGPLASSYEMEAELLAASCELCRTSKARRLGVLSDVDGYERLVDGVERKVTTTPSWRLQLPDDPEQFRRNLKKRSKSHHFSVGKAKKAGVEVRDARGDGADLRRFYRLYLGTMRRHRSLPRPFKKFSLAQELFGPDVCRLYVAELDGKPVAGLVCHFFNGMVEIMYNASDEGSLWAHPNHALYEHAIVTAIAEGLEWFDFGGASREESLGSFKRRWGSEPVDRFNYAFPAAVDPGAGAGALSRARQSSGESEGMLSRVWGRTPLTLTRAAGELIWRYA